ncbi:MAG: glycosyltransferase [Lachnospiraceae bacterium]|nr:glycosyltransferase [Lachnospiraceae bacterium]
MNKDDIKISVITVTYNSESTLADTMRSVAEQTYLPYEYIIVDGKSSDGTLSVAESFRGDLEAKGVRFDIVSEADNGIYDAMNKGIDRASGDIIGIINSDDWYERDALQVVATEYEREEFDLFYADVRMIKPDGSSFIKHARDRKYATSRDWNHPTTFITGRTYDKYRYRTETIHDDYDLILRLKRDNVKIRVVNRTLADFRMNGVSHSRSIAAAIGSIKTKYAIYRRNGYGRGYILECVMVELGKLIIG